MKYIFKFIEYINETNILSLATLILTIGYLRYLYNKKEEVEELYTIPVQFVDKNNIIQFDINGWQ